MALRIHSPTSTGALQECRQAFFKAHKNADKLRIFHQEPSCRRLADFVRPRASLPRTTKEKPAYCCTPIIDGKKIFLRTLKCHLQRSWSCDPEDSKSKPMVRARKPQADRDPSLVVGRGHVSWTILSLIALTRQKQLAKGKQQANQCPNTWYVFSKTASLVGTAVPLRHLKKFRCQREMGPRETTHENKILFYWTSMYIVGNMPSTDVLRNKSKRIILLIAWNAIGQEILANFVVK